MFGLRVKIFYEPRNPMTDLSLEERINKWLEDTEQNGSYLEIVNVVQSQSTLADEVRVTCTIFYRIPSPVM